MSNHIAGDWAKGLAQRLGLIRTPLFGRERPDAGERHQALLDGLHASFLVSDSDEQVPAAADWAWSSNVRSHVSLQHDQVVVSRTSGSKEIFTRRSVDSKLSEFLRYLEIDPDSHRVMGAIDHLIHVFRKHRTHMQTVSSPVSDLESFLYLLALTQEPEAIGAHRAGAEIAQRYCLNNFDPTTLDDNYVSRFVEEVSLNSASMRRLFTPLAIRHAGGALFQEAHAEVLAEPIQMTLFGLVDAGQQRLDLSLGAYYTPIGLTRTLTEIAIEPHLNQESIVIQDPACGSGIFLCESIRVLQRRNFAGRIRIIGRDISSPAVQMARYSIACALLDWPGHKAQWNVTSGDFFEDQAPAPSCDVILMNPPFLSWQALSLSQKEFVRSTLGASFAGRPDLSTAFIERCLRMLLPGGTLATLLPRGVLDSQQGAKWRESILKENDVQLIGTFGDHGLFRHAMVSIGATVIEKRPAAAPAGERATLMVWADERANSAEGALRTLRRLASAGNSVEDRSSNWSIYSIKSHDLSANKSWLPTPNALGTLLETIQEQHHPTIGQLFRVRQGIKTGLNEAFVISDEELKELPPRERRYFRRVANGEDIINGEIRSSTNVFYVPDLFKIRRELLDSVPVFARRLLRFEGALKRRPKSDPKLWWEPLWPRKDLAVRSPRIMTKMFGAADMAAPDPRGEFLPLQAYAWMPYWSEMKIDEKLAEPALWWYCRLLNSRVFFLLRRELRSASTAGGQLDVSPKYINKVPIPRPTEDELIRLASTGRPNLIASKENDELVAVAYGTSPASWPTHAAY
jgi:adenine-specific DNA-methyltransferase